MKITEFLSLSERERDAFVAREVMGWKEEMVTDEMVEAHSNDAVMWKGNDMAIWPPLLKSGWAEHSGYYWETFEPTTTWEGMRLVVEKVSLWWEMYHLDDGKTWRAHVYLDQCIIGEYESESLPEAVCIAAGLALGVLEE